MIPAEADEVDVGTWRLNAVPAHSQGGEADQADAGQEAEEGQRSGSQTGTRDVITASCV